jgi:cobalt-zinc-cadmium efflux system outer membrane protein
MKRSICSTFLVGACWLSLLPSQARPQAGEQTVEVVTASAPAAVSTYARLIDPLKGQTADELVRYALEHNGELLAARKMIDEARGRLHQAALKANPMLEANGKQAVNTSDNNQMVGLEWPLELGGRREARTLVGQREVELREAEARDFERKLAAEVRTKYAEAIAAARNLKFADELLRLTRDSHQLVQARVEHGKSAPLESSEVWVELNRADVLRLSLESKTEVALLELKKAIGMPPDEELQLRGEFIVEAKLPPPPELLQRALATRPDLAALRAAETLAEAQAEQARREGRVDASLFAGYERMSSGYDVLGFNAAGSPVPVVGVFHYATFGVRFTLPVRNKNQGLIEAALAAAAAARQRREFAELVVRNEIASATTRLGKAQSALAVYRDKVREAALRNVDIVHRAYQVGYKTAIDYLAEQRRFTEIETGYTDTLKEYFEALVEIERVTGVTVREERQ